ncbi:ArsI/CadI family heavy metal resistance metalloenzyme [Variovorax sp. MHTC-1]|uniref:ArsI/CadI family heavy metal resistance metalloenzyme n=1 Tax=Variovorax sp. MHTC-1 TaxID=2495593 RepID=UPI000F8801F6|nr:ArsI/CadI family heavy metal resistance metalloenzyme [Variovorax sp. MHTC-1]RST53913.1 glyoxalase/bleomycin resistance/dioxygenase family protein [Variovorax sp. MHTC-1]
MKRFHVHLHVDDLAKSIGFYSKLFAAEPARVEQDYAKWMLDDPRVNFAISTRGDGKGVDHLGIQADDEAELAELKTRAQAADQALVDEGEALCCYSRSEKHWVTDPQGVAWEHYRTLESAQVYGESRPVSSDASASACCAGASSRGKPIAVPVKAASSCC